ncbi:MAG TPA: YqeG family HAD IIIA-type phosphatase [Clostridia bacterium]|nr:YqeG family HAD IIIA-type phosphatase [Clostridia bacterium]
MSEIFFPGLYVNSIRDITPDLLEKHRIRGLILDIDNTLVPNHVADADENAVEWIGRIRAAGYKLCIVSNASKKRVVRFNDRLQLDAVHRAMKPGTGAFIKAGRLMGIKNENIAVVGDQIFTDVYGGNRAGMFTILVHPIDKREGKLVRFKRIFEKRILIRYTEWSKKNGIH